MKYTATPLAKFTDDTALAVEPGLYGGKGASLNQLVTWNVPVPAYICITALQFEEVLLANDLEMLVRWMASPSESLPLSIDEINKRFDECVIPEYLEGQIDKFIRRYPHNRFAVRSSSTLEDGAASSFAGLYLSILNVPTLNATLNAMKACWAAFFSDRAIDYSSQRKVSTKMGMALIIQCLVPAEKSGVLFSVDPIRGLDKEMLIEACFGLGEALVSGQVNADQYRYDWFEDRETERHVARKDSICVPTSQSPYTALIPLAADRAQMEVLSSVELASLSRLAQQIQCQAGYPVDIEWAMYREQLYILQSRPITDMGFAGIQGEWSTADFRDGGVSSSVCTPFMSSLYKMVMDSSMADHIKKLGLPRRKNKDIWLKSFYSRPYWNVNAAKHYLSKIPNYNERVFDEGLGIEPRYVGNGIETKVTPTTLFYGLRALWVIKRNCKRKLLTCPAFAKAQNARLSQLCHVSLTALSTAELYEQYDLFVNEEYFRNESSYFDFIYDNSNLNSLFKESLSKTDFNLSGFPDLLAGLEGVSHMVQINSLWEIRASIEACCESQTYWHEHTAEEICSHYQSGRRDVCLIELDSYLEKYGHHSRKELDLTVPRYAEEPTYVIKQLLDVMQQPRESDPRKRNSIQNRCAESACQKMLASVKPWRRKALYSRLQQVRNFLWWREELRDLSTRFYFHMRLMTCEVARRLVDDGFLQAANDVFFLEKDQLLSVLGGEHSPTVCQSLVTRNRCYYDSFKNYVIPDEIGDRHRIHAPTVTVFDELDRILGVAGSPGVVTGIARIIADIDDADSLQPGDILVTRCTDPGWTLKFSMLKGVVTETGGVLSHAAVICREYGIPAVLAVKGATREIVSGDSITIDGGLGQVMFNR